MSNDTDYELLFLADTKEYLEKVIQYLQKKGERWNDARKAGKSFADFLKDLGKENAAEVASWGFEFGNIEEVDGQFQIKATTWANENFRNMWISGEKGELYFLQLKFEDLTIEGIYDDEYSRGRIYGYEKFEDPDAYDEDEFSWGHGDEIGYSDATKKILIRAYDGTLRLSEAKMLVAEGADLKGYIFSERLCDHFSKNSDNFYGEWEEAHEFLWGAGMPYDLGVLLDYCSSVGGLNNTLRKFARAKGIVAESDSEVYRKILLMSLPRKMQDKLCLRRHHENDDKKSQKIYRRVQNKCSRINP